MISTIIKYFRFGGTNAPKLMRGMGWTLLTWRASLMFPL